MTSYVGTMPCELQSWCNIPTLLLSDVFLTDSFSFLFYCMPISSLRRKHAAHIYLHIHLNVSLICVDGVWMFFNSMGDWVL